MALVVKDRVRQLTTTTGTGTLTLGGSVTGFQDFSVIGDGNTTYYAIVDASTGDWEVGIGTYTSSGTTLSRDSVLESSNSNSLVSFSAGTKDVFCTYPADRSVTSDYSNTFTTNQVISVSDATNAALRITQTGAGHALLVEDSSNPDATPLVVDTNGFLVAGYTTPVVAGLTQSGRLATANNVANTGQGVQIMKFRASTSLGADLEFVKSASSTLGTNAILNSSYVIGTIWFNGADGTSYIPAAKIEGSVDGTTGTNDMPGKLTFSTTADGESSPTERMRIDNAGRVGIGGTPSTSYTLYIGKNPTGNSTVSAVAARGTIQSDVTDYRGLMSWPSIDAAANLSTLYHYRATQGTYSGTVTNQYGFHIDSGFTGATNNYGFYSNIASGTGRWNFYANGTADNYFAGTTLVGTTTNTNSSTVVSNGTISETVSGTQYLVASQYDVGSAPNQIPLNQYLGELAYVDTEVPALNVGEGITTGTGTICKANAGLMGGIYQMTILIDLTGLNSGGTAGDIIGVNGTSLPCYIAQLPAMTVLGGRMTCLETPAGGDTDIDLYSANEGTGVEDGAITSLTETQIINAGTQSAGTVTYFSADPSANQYFYLVGQSTTNATYTAGRFLIEVFGVQ